jgi:hypothetical protein
MTFKDGQAARLAALKSAESRRAKKREKLTLESVEVAFGSLETLEDAQRRLERLGVWSAAGLLAGSVASAAVRSVEVWLRAHESKLTQAVVEDLKRDVDRIRDELARTRTRR